MTRFYCADCIENGCNKPLRRDPYHDLYICPFCDKEYPGRDLRLMEDTKECVEDGSANRSGSGSQLSSCPIK